MRLLECVTCSRRTETDSLDSRCPACRSALMLVDRDGALEMRELETLPPGVWRYRGALPAVRTGSVVSLGEGATPLLSAKRLGEELGFRNLMIKDETRNPTGSFIDRGSTVLVSLAREAGVKRISCTTTGNLGASLAAYCAKAGIDVEVRIHPRTDHGKLYQMIAYGAKVEILQGGAENRFNDSLSVSAANAFILDGEKTTGFEIVQEMGWSQPRAVVLPVGTGGHLTMVSRALDRLHSYGLTGPPSCRLVGVQLKASSPIEEGPRRRRPRGPADEPLTELEESEPTFRETAMRAIRESGGRAVEVSAREAIRATSLLARTEGVFAEPASASVVAAVRELRESRTLDRDETIVCVITGTGLKDTKAIRRMARMPRGAAANDLPLKPVQVGSTKLRILEALSTGHGFGYDLWKELDRSSKITTASVYQHLSELEGAALVRRSRAVTVRGKERVYYELTGKGRELLVIVGKTRKAGFSLRLGNV